MLPVDLKSLVSKMNDTCRQALEGSVSLTLSRTHYNVEIEHWLTKLLEQPNGDLALILRHFGVDASRVTKDLTRTLDGFKTGSSRPPALSPHIVELAREAWVYASLNQGAPQVRSGHLLCALLSADSLSAIGRQASSQFADISADSLHAELNAITANSDESQQAAEAEAQADSGAPGAPAKPTKTPSLDQFTVDLTASAKAGKIDPVLGRDAEVRQIVDILTRRRQNNPILTGEAGVGKTAVVEGFALRVAAGDVPEPLRDISIRTLDLALLQAGAGVRGEFENRLKSVIEEVKSSPKPIILFIDEAHTMIGAGGQAGQGDAANLLKPALARGELRTIAATTWAEYKKYFERDAALARRFQVVKVEEPDEKPAIEMMRGLTQTLEKHHNVRILNEAIVESVRLSKRYISGRQLPDKSVSLLDTACANVAIGQGTVPGVIEDARRRRMELERAIDSLEREQAAGTDHEEELQTLREEDERIIAELQALESRWEEEKQLVSEIRAVRSKLEGRSDTNANVDEDATETPDGSAQGDAPGPLSDEDRARLRGELAELNAKLEALQGESPLMHVCVDAQAVAKVVGEWTGIPVGRMVSDEINTVLNIEEHMAQSVVGQDHALEAIAQSIKTSRANMADPRIPIGVFMLAGTSGVGKTETAITLANLLYGGEQNMTVINMTEFKEEHKVSLLMGSPPGYVGYGEGGVLTEAVRRKPYSVVLLDEMEKAHPGVQDVFYQVFDKGMMTDGEGREIDFKNTVIIMTTNAGTDTIMSLCEDPETAPDAEGLAEALHEELLKTFKPAFLGRLKIVPYFPLSDEIMAQIIELKLQKIVRRLSESYRAELTYGPELIQHINDRCQEVSTGARNVDHILTRSMLPELSTELLSRMSAGHGVNSVKVKIGDGGELEYEIH